LDNSVSVSLAGVAVWVRDWPLKSVDAARTAGIRFFI
jgi:hypothetical protein